jgi:NAD(P)-dependent dehydrogenase (short-subunit alcohol dehydrogenase family)
MMKKSIVITGAGSGVGRSIALRFAHANWSVALIGRRREKLLATASDCGPGAAVFPCDVADYRAVQETIELVREAFSRIDVLVNCAGINIPQRSWTEVSANDFNKVIAINLTGAFHCIRACLDELLSNRGTIVNINSEAGRRATAKAGCSYVASKYGLAGLTESLNAELRMKGLRCVSIFPGEINTSLLDQRPVPPPPEQRLKMVQPEDVADCVWTAVNLPGNSLVEELVVRPTETDYQ